MECGQHWDSLPEVLVFSGWDEQRGSDALRNASKDGGFLPLLVGGEADWSRLAPTLVFRYENLFLSVTLSFFSFLYFLLCLCPKVPLNVFLRYLLKTLYSECHAYYANTFSTCMFFSFLSTLFVWNTKLLTCLRTWAVLCPNVENGLWNIFFF